MMPSRHPVSDPRSLDDNSREEKNMHSATRLYGHYWRIKFHDWSKLSDVLTNGEYIQYQHWKDEHNWSEWPYKRGKIIKDYTGSVGISKWGVGHINGLATSNVISDDLFFGIICRFGQLDHCRKPFPRGLTATLDEEYFSTYFWPHIRCFFFSVFFFYFGVAQVLILGTIS